MAARITHVAITDYRSIGSCDVELQPLTLLVGPNGSGKSNFLDALRFLHDCMHAPLEHVMQARSGLVSLLRKLPNSQLAESFLISIRFELDDLTAGYYRLSIARGSTGSPEIKEERCAIGDDWYFYGYGEITSSFSLFPPFTFDRPLLVAFGGLPQFAPVYHLLAGFTFYIPKPERMRLPAASGSGAVLSTDASNAADVYTRIQRLTPELARRIDGYLHSFNPEFSAMTTIEHGNYRWLGFVPAVNPSGWKINGDEVSDGTLRAIGILLAIFQASTESNPLSLVGLEEPESNLHPAAAGVLLDALLEASNRVQIIASTHSADLLDRTPLPENSLLAVALHNGETIIGPVDDVGKSILRQRLYTAGELLRSNQLSPSRA